MLLFLKGMSSFDKQRKIVDCFLFYNEVDILEYRLSVLWEFVDFFVISESKYSFVGKEKPFFSEDSKFDRFREKMIVLKIESVPFHVPDVTKNEQWCNENYQRDHLMKGVDELLEKNLIDEDTILILNDVDEIPDTDFLSVLTLKATLPTNTVFVLQQKYHCYNLNIIRNIDWCHCKVLSVKTWKCSLSSEPFSTIRLYGVTLPFNKNVYPQLIMRGGWHLSYFGDAHFILNKIQNFSHQEIKVSLEEIIDRKERGMDITGRTDLTYSIVPEENNTYLPPRPFFFYKQL